MGFTLFYNVLLMIHIKVLIFNGPLLPTLNIQWSSSALTEEFSNWIYVKLKMETRRHVPKTFLIIYLKWGLSVPIIMSYMCIPHILSIYIEVDRCLVLLIIIFSSVRIIIIIIIDIGITSPKCVWCNVVICCKSFWLYEFFKHR